MTVSNRNFDDNEGVTLKELFSQIADWFSFFKSKIFKIALIGFLGGVIGFCYAWLGPINYPAKLTFVVEESKGSGGSLGGLASIAGQFGVDLGGGNGGGLLSGENILIYLKSTSLAREVLKLPFDSSKKKSIADEYADVYELKSLWKENKNVGQIINFTPQDEFGKVNYTRLQDSLINIIIDKITKGQFIVSKTDKKASFIEVTAIMKTETLSKKYCESIVNEAVLRFKKAKTARQQNTVDILQKRADSILVLLGKKTSANANLQTASSTMDINPVYKANTNIAVETTSRDKTILVTLFGEVIKNLELAKFTLSQETPVIQIVDMPVYPIKKLKKSRLENAIIFSIVFAFCFTLWIAIKRYIKSII